MNFKITKGDIDAFFGVLFDGAPKIITGVIVLTPILGADIVFGKLLPSIGLAVLLSSLMFHLLGESVKKSSGNNDLVALPGGINAGRFFVFLFSVMLPTWSLTEDATLTLFVGIGAHIISAVLSIIFAFVGQKLVDMIPSEALFGSLAGGAITWLTLSTFNDMLVTPVIAFVSIFIVLSVYLAKVKIPTSPAVMSIVIGIILGFLTGSISFSVFGEAMANFGFYAPGGVVLSENYFSNVALGTVEAIKFLPTIFVFTLGEVISNLQGISQAKACGDEYPVVKSLLWVNIVSLMGAIVGNPFPVGIWWGYASWKERKATTSYPILVGVTYLILCMTGIISVVTSVIPVASVLPLLIFIGLVSLQNAFADADKKYYGIMAFCLAIPIVEWGGSLGENLGFLSSGAALIALVWGSGLVFIAKKDWIKTSLTFLTGGVLTFLGLIHTGSFIVEFLIDETTKQFNGINYNINWQFTTMYLAAAVVAYIFAKTDIIKYEE